MCEGHDLHDEVINRGVLRAAFRARLNVDDCHLFSPNGFKKGRVVELEPEQNATLIGRVNVALSD